MMNVCCLLEERWRGRGIKEGNISCSRLEKEMELMVWEELCEKVVEV